MYKKFEDACFDLINDTDHTPSHQSQDVQLQRDAEEQKRMFEELQDIQNILIATKQELLSQRKINTQLQNNVTDAEQENLRVSDADLNMFFSR